MKTIDSSKEGEVTDFYRNGNIQSIVDYQNDKANGNSFQFYSDGSIQAHAYWNDDKLSGYSTYYFSDSIGSLRNIYKYDSNGKLIAAKQAPFPGADPKIISLDSVDNR